MKKYNKDSFLGYIKNTMSTDDMMLIYKDNNIKQERCELYGDFALSLVITILDTYMGDDVTNLDDQFKHFEWSWKRTIANFIEEGLDFESDLLYNYFLEFMVEVYYELPDKDNIQIDGKICKLWADIFDFHKNKTNSDLDALIEIYEIFTKSLKIL
jgi:hypothetical protein